MFRNICYIDAVNSPLEAKGYVIIRTYFVAEYKFCCTGKFLTERSDDVECLQQTTMRESRILNRVKRSLIMQSWSVLRWRWTKWCLQTSRMDLIVLR